MRLHIALTLVLIGAPVVVAAAQAAHKVPQVKSGSAPAQPEAGEIAFQRHCSRCHAAPEGFSPRISGTIVRHMRVRASLSEQEEKDLLRFFNP